VLLGEHAPRRFCVPISENGTFLDPGSNEQFSIVCKDPETFQNINRLLRLYSCTPLLDCFTHGFVFNKTDLTGTHTAGEEEKKEVKNESTPLSPLPTKKGKKRSNSRACNILYHVASDTLRKTAEAKEDGRNEYRIETTSNPTIPLSSSPSSSVGRVIGAILQVFTKIQSTFLVVLVAFVCVMCYHPICLFIYLGSQTARTFSTNLCHIVRNAYTASQIVSRYLMNVRLEQNNNTRDDEDGDEDGDGDGDDNYVPYDGDDSSSDDGDYVDSESESENTDCHHGPRQNDDVSDVALGTSSLRSGKKYK